MSKLQLPFSRRGADVDPLHCPLTLNRSDTIAFERIAVDGCRRCTTGFPGAMRLGVLPGHPEGCSWVGAGRYQGAVIFDRDASAVFRILGEASEEDIALRVEWLLPDRTGKKPKELQKNQ